MLNITAPTFDRVYAGYTQPEAQPITIINTGNSDATIIGVTLTGDVNAFILSVKDGAIITAGSTDNTTYTIRPAGGLSAGTYTATITIAYNNDTQASADVSFTVSRRSTGSNTPTYPPTVEKTDNGSTDVAPANPRQGAKVTITPKPDEGYETAGVTVTDSKGSPVKVTDNGDGTWSFTQPASKVDIKVTFVEVETACDGGRDCPAYHLTDVNADAWYHEAVDYVLINGMMSGYPGGLFAPGDSLSRGMLAQILYNAAGKPAVFGKSAFIDVADGAWYTDAVIWASRNGIVEGYNGLFAPEDPVTREQCAVMLWRCAGCPAAIQKQLESADADQVSAWALEAMLWAVENGVLKGYNGILNPGGGITRAEAAQMLKNFIENIG